MGVIDILGKVDDVASWTASPPPDRPIAGAVGAAMQKVCNSFAQAPEWAKEAARNTPSGAQGIPGALGIVCKPYWDGAGVDGPVIDSPFSGGQCPGDSYRISLSSTANFVDANGPAGNQFLGDDPRLGGIDYVGPVTGLRFFGARPNSFGFQEWRFEVTSNDGATVTGGLITTIGTVNDFAIGSVTISGLAITNLSGPDDCGDPPGELVPGANPPPDPGPLTPEETPTFDPTNPTGAPIPIPDIPSLPGFPDLPIDDDALGGGGGAPPPAAGGDGLPGLPDAAGEPAGAVNGDGDGEEVPFGEPPAGRVWVGCVVSATVDSRLGNIAGTAPTSTVYPQVVGNVALKHGDFYSSSVPIRSKFQDLFRRNSALIVDGCFIHARPGVSLSVRPISAVTCPDNPCGD